MRAQAVSCHLRPTVTVGENIAAAGNGKQCREWTSALDGPCLGQDLFIAPHFKRKGAVRNRQVDDHVSGTLPAILLVEPCCPFIAYCTYQPGNLYPKTSETRFCIRQQSSCNPSTSRTFGDKQLINPTILDDAQAKGPTWRACDSHTG